MAKYDVAIVGGGLFGSIIARAARARGANVALIDKGEKNWGSGPAACLIKPSWVSGLGHQVVDPAMALLNRLYKVESIDFKVGPLMQKVWWVDPASILAESRVYDDVINISRGQVLGLHDTYEADMIINAAGIWTDRLLPPGVPKSGVTSRAGVAFLFPEAKIEQPFISPWAPYRQLVAFNRGDGLWVSDGTAIKPENLTDERIQESYVRCLKAVDRHVSIADRMTKLVGNRPYVSGAKPCYLRYHDDWLAVVTGGAKNGTLAAAWAASQIIL